MSCAIAAITDATAIKTFATISMKLFIFFFRFFFIGFSSFLDYIISHGAPYVKDIRGIYIIIGLTIMSISLLLIYSYYPLQYANPYI